MDISDGLLFFYIIPTILIGFILYVAVKEFNEYKRNNAAEIEMTHAKIVSKRTELLGGGDSFMAMDYYITFQHAQGKRIEFKVNGLTYGELIESDKGLLKFQRKRFLHFDRM